MTVLFNEAARDLFNEQIYLILSKSEYFYLENEKRKGTAINIEQYFVESDWDSNHIETFYGKVRLLLHYLIKELEFVTDSEILEPSLNLIAVKGNAVAQVVDRLNKKGFILPFRVNHELPEYKLIQFLITEIQMNVLLNQKTSKTSKQITEDTSDQMEVETKTAGNEEQEIQQLTFQLDKICRILSISIENLSSQEEVLSAVISYFQTLEQKEPHKFQQFTHTTKVFGPIRLNDQQFAQLKEIQEITFQDFNLRRQMLLKRFDVTIQAFLDKYTEDEAPPQKGPASSSSVEAPKLVGNEQVRQAIEAQKNYLESRPVSYQIEDALNAPYSLLIEQSQKITSQSHLLTQKHKSIVKKVIIGKVPDRGGRVNELRPKRLDEYRSGGGGGGGKSGGNNNNKGGGGGGGGGQKFHGKRPASSPAADTQSQASNTSNSSSNNNNNNNNQKGGRVVQITNSNDDGNANNKGQHPHQRKKGKKDHQSS